MKKNIFGYSYIVWRQLQEGQEKIIRWSTFHRLLPEKLRKQNGHEHRCSLGFLVAYFSVQMRPYVKIDELLVSRCAELHDVPEGILGEDISARLKKDNNDVDEYNALKKLFQPLGKNVWKEIQRCYLLQFARKNPSVFPRDARDMMKKLQKENMNEILFFEGMQLIDYLYYAFECHHERDHEQPLEEVSLSVFSRIEEVSNKLPGFSKVVWTPERRRFCKKYADLNRHYS